ncbi:MAG: hypothetical protein MK033_08915 [Candidatus Caenarcaniphilales bacterium]|nr:hypothetical protein [Candidatus Caenarcaniphilales bacterium]
MKASQIPERLLGLLGASLALTSCPHEKIGVNLSKQEVQNLKPGQEVVEYNERVTKELGLEDCPNVKLLKYENGAIVRPGNGNWILACELSKQEKRNQGESISIPENSDSFFGKTYSDLLMDNFINQASTRDLPDLQSDLTKFLNKDCPSSKFISPASLYSCPFNNSTGDLQSNNLNASTLNTNNFLNDHVINDDSTCINPDILTDLHKRCL